MSDYISTHTGAQIESALKKIDINNICQIIISPIPRTDLQEVDGSLLTKSSYPVLYNKISALYSSGDYSSLFDTEENWQTAVATYGVCGKFVFDGENETVRIPKYGNRINTSNKLLNTFYYMRID